MVRVRHDLAEMFPGCEFLLPTRTDKGSVVGIRFDGRTVLAEASPHFSRDFVARRANLGRIRGK